MHEVIVVLSFVLIFATICVATRNSSVRQVTSINQHGYFGDNEVNGLQVARASRCYTCLLYTIMYPPLVEKWNVWMYNYRPYFDSPVML